MIPKAIETTRILHEDIRANSNMNYTAPVRYIIMADDDKVYEVRCAENITLHQGRLYRFSYNPASTKYILQLRVANNGVEFWYTITENDDEFDVTQCTPEYLMEILL